MVIHQFINPYRYANTFVIEAENNQVILIDFGNYSLELFAQWLIKNNRVVKAVLLTHEHSDHCNGLQKLHDKYPFDLYCSQKCADNIKNSRQNFSYYIQELDTFELNLPAIVVSENETITIAGIPFTFTETPGHSPGGICIFSGNTVFTGDTLLNNTKTPLSFPHSNRADYAKSVKKLLTFLKPGMVIYPGHEKPFVYDSVQSLTIGNII